MKLLLENWRKYLKEEETHILLEQALLEEGMMEWAKEKWIQLDDIKKKALKVSAKEWVETKDAVSIISKIFRGESINPEEKKLVQDQAIDVLKTTTLGGVYALPGGTAAVLLLIIALQKMGFQPLPSAYYSIESGETNETPT